MEEKELKIQVPEGYEIDKENSTFKCIKFKKRTIGYFEVTRHYNTFNTNVLSISADFTEKLRAAGKLMLVAKYLNDGWIPDFKDTKTIKYYIAVDLPLEILGVFKSTNVVQSFVYFKTKELAKEAIKILGEDTVKKALSNEY